MMKSISSNFEELLYMNFKVVVDRNFIKISEISFSYLGQLFQAVVKFVEVKYEMPLRVKTHE